MVALLFSKFSKLPFHDGGAVSIQILHYSVNCSRFPLRLELLGRKLKEVPLAAKSVSRAGEVSVTSVVK
jgi:hypothetical protein